MTTEALVLALVGLLLPLLSSFVARAHWPAEAAGLLTLLFAAAEGVIAEATAGGADFHWRDALTKAAIAYVAAVIARARIWAGSTTDAKLLATPHPKPHRGV